eukprot:GHVL01014738.1.p1 GENE.GHVL01014738.1~~GHVL01014738.1.p1  ORF type:complete len:130 (+),score=12.65 GHVL01014738.1:39-428(+)
MFKSSNLTFFKHNLICVQYYKSTVNRPNDIFQTLLPDQTHVKQKPSDKVIGLVDEIMNLTVMEAADLCDLCNLKLSRDKFKLNTRLMPGRMPFPHPCGLFGAYRSAGIQETDKKEEGTIKAEEQANELR